jgi:hypothetical protein
MASSWPKGPAQTMKKQTKRRWKVETVCRKGSAAISPSSIEMFSSDCPPSLRNIYSQFFWGVRKSFDPELSPMGKRMEIMSW